MEYLKNLLQSQNGRRIAIAVLVLLIALAGYLSITRGGATTDVPPPLQPGLTMEFMCGRCEAVFPMPYTEVSGYIASRYREGTVLGIDCPRCKALKCADLATRCPRCRKAYLAQMPLWAMGMANKPGEGYQPTCPSCGTRLYDALGSLEAPK